MKCSSGCQTHESLTASRECLSWCWELTFIFTLLGGSVTGGRAQAMEDLGEDATLSTESQAPLTLKGFLLAQPSEATVERL